MAFSLFAEVRSAAGRRRLAPSRVPTACSSYAAQASYIAVSATASVREMIVGRAPSRSTSRAVASSETSSHSYAADGLYGPAACSDGITSNTAIAEAIVRIVFIGRKTLRRVRRGCKSVTRRRGEAEEAVGLPPRLPLKRLC